MCELTNQWRALKRQELQQSIFWQRGEYSAAFWALKHVNLFSSNTKKIDKPENEHSMSLLTSHFEVHSLNLFNETSNIWMYVGCTLTQAFHLYQGPSAHTSPALYRKLLSVSLDTAESESTSSGQGLWFLKKRGLMPPLERPKIKTYKFNTVLPYWVHLKKRNEAFGNTIQSSITVCSGLTG